MGVETSVGLLEADHYVLALGTDAPQRVKPLGIRIPVYPLEGYSLSLPITDDAAAPRISVTDFERKVVYARIGGDLTFPGATDFGALKPWCGRPRRAARRSSGPRRTRTSGSTWATGRSASPSRSPRGVSWRISPRDARPPCRSTASPFNGVRHHFHNAKIGV